MSRDIIEPKVVERNTEAGVNYRCYTEISAHLRGREKFYVNSRSISFELKLCKVKGLKESYRLPYLVPAELREMEDLAVVHHHLLLALHRDALPVLAPPNNFRRGESVSPTRHVDVLILPHRHG